MNFDWRKVVSTVAPALASAFGTPVAGLAVSALCSAFGITEADPAKKEDALSVAIQAGTPEVMLAIKQADNDFKIQCKKLDLDLEKIIAADRADARARQVAAKDKTPAVLAYLLTFGFFGMLAALLLIPVPSVNQATVYLMIGSLGTAWIGAMVFFHGSTSGSKNKDILVRDLLLPTK